MTILFTVATCVPGPPMNSMILPPVLGYVHCEDTMLLSTTALLTVLSTKFISLSYLHSYIDDSLYHLQIVRKIKLSLFLIFCSTCTLKMTLRNSAKLTRNVKCINYKEIKQNEPQTIKTTANM